jgi:hypothetical protein
MMVSLLCVVSCRLFPVSHIAVRNTIQLQIELSSEGVVTLAQQQSLKQNGYRAMPSRAWRELSKQDKLASEIGEDTRKIIRNPAKSNSHLPRWDGTRAGSNQQVCRDKVSS